MPELRALWMSCLACTLCPYTRKPAKQYDNANTIDEYCWLEYREAIAVILMIDEILQKVVNPESNDDGKKETYNQSTMLEQEGLCLFEIESRERAQEEEKLVGQQEAILICIDNST